MDSISSLDTSLYSGLIEGFAPKTTQPVPAVNTEEAEYSGAYNGGSSYPNNDEVDLSNYYNDVRPEDLLTKSGQYFIESSQRLDNTMVVAMQNGYSVQDVCNIRLAEMAYKASAFVFDAVSEMSTFEVDV
jgi:hypothetical protein